MEDQKSETVQPQPGSTIQPGSSPLPPVVPQNSAEPITPSETSAPQQPAAEPTRPEDPAQITWTASEFVENAKSFDWYLALGVVSVLVAAAFYILFRDVVTTIVIIVVGLTFGYFAKRKPRQLDYKLDSQGLTIDTKHFPYGLFRSFAVLDEGHFSSIAFLPLKRFGIMTTIYYDPQDEDRILALINQHLPLEPREHDALDRFMKRIRF
ncbi:MAG TPA: hypothetical protein VN031_02640 [Candidatus Microsaccharimonas sp.]|nr:hypothetical protein [Candidatus Microsaccharimonas sp.]